MSINNKGPLIGQGRTADVYTWGDNQVLKLFHKRVSLEWIEREARTGNLAFEAGLATAKVGSVINVEDRHGIVFERVDGPSMLAEISAKPWKLRRSARILAELHAAVHEKKLPDLPSQKQIIRDNVYSANVLDGEQKQVIGRLLDELPDGDLLCHGDFHPDNIIVSENGAITIDWTTATRGNPLADVARTSLILQLGEMPPDTPVLTRLIVRLGRKLFHRIYLRRYFRLRPDNRDHLIDWKLPITAARLGDGIPEERDQLLTLIRNRIGG